MAKHWYGLMAIAQNFFQSFKRVDKVRWISAVEKAEF